MSRLAADPLALLMATGAFFSLLCAVGEIAGWIGQRQARRRR